MYYNQKTSKKIMINILNNIYKEQSGACSSACLALFGCSWLTDEICNGCIIVLPCALLLTISILIAILRHLLPVIRVRSIYYYSGCLDEYGKEERDKSINMSLRSVEKICFYMFLIEVLFMIIVAFALIIQIIIKLITD